ncbi:CRAL-TRIO domain containing protein, partial [Oryctes borbonicus]
MFTRLMDRKIDTYDSLNQMKLFDMLTSMAFRYIGPTEGQIFLMDMEGCSLAHLMRVNLVHLKKNMFYVQETLPVRLKGIHIINVSPITDKLLSMSKPFLKKEMIDLIHTHSKIETLFDYIPKEALPNELGGKAGTFKELHEKQIKLAMENAQYFIEEEAEIADESKRLGKPKNLDNIFGIEGTFK